ncbi:MAG: FecR domain-containing protein [Candidatus Andeanibacterium colombiense]|uniref:FecR domain-containing protein n=1 Tax=Candidatus Andeanibacterium colombiense TaxID=3121345 RepID=A0AAJ6BLK8_9SPHN|nr:MAG: FecR domain-containing protein [Sphingomonadaceae bacterium]
MTPAPHPEQRGDIAATAAEWVERLTSGEPSPEDVARLRAWLAEDPEHRCAYEQARAVWTELPRTSLRKYRRAPLRLAAGTALAAGLAFALLFPGFHDHATAAGEVRRLTLPDGTTAWLDSDSAIDLAFDDDHRTIRLARGRVALAAAHGDARPLAVEAGDATITDVGTVFAVDRGGDGAVDGAGGLLVAVSEGLVDVAQGARTTRLAGGEAASFDGPSPHMRAVHTGEFAWRDGRIVLDQIPLDQALRELDRYYDGRIVLTDRSIGGRLVSGTLFPGRAEEGVDTLARSQGLKVTHLPWLILVRAAD